MKELVLKIAEGVSYVLAYCDDSTWTEFRGPRKPWLPLILSKAEAEYTGVCDVNSPYRVQVVRVLVILEYGPRLAQWMSRCHCTGITC